ncbi:hypothetical protein AOLI_G00163240 [Acnodon oligacanthus]
MTVLSRMFEQLSERTTGPKGVVKGSRWTEVAPDTQDGWAVTAADGDVPIGDVSMGHVPPSHPSEQTGGDGKASNLPEMGNSLISP